MYTSFYGLSCNPFLKGVATKDAFISSDYKNFIERLDYLKEVKGIGLFIGSPGLGKTFTLRSFCNSLNKDLYKVIYISPTNLSLFDFYKSIGRELNIEVGSCYKTDLYRKIQEALKKLVDEEKVEPIIIIDDAHFLSKEILEEFKVLFDFEMDSKDYTTVVLCGHPSLKTEVSKNIYDSLKQRIIVNYKMSGLSREEVKSYVETRLTIANANKEIFAIDALNALYSCSKSSPRRLNNLILNSLILGAQSKKVKIDSEIIMSAKSEMDLE